MRNPIILEKLGPAVILNQNPIFEMGSKSWIKVLVKPAASALAKL